MYNSINHLILNNKAKIVMNLIAKGEEEEEEEEEEEDILIKLRNLGKN